MTASHLQLVSVRGPLLPTVPKRKRARAYVPNGDVGRRLAVAQNLQLQIQKLEAELGHHRAWLLSHMQRHKLDKLELGQFVVQRRTRHNWSYSPETERDALALRQTQKWEQSEGIATDNPTVYIALSTQEPKQ
jgi:hypothetical protein